METGSEIDQFRVLEGKIEKLIEMVTLLKNEKEALAEKVRIQDERLSDLTGQLEALKTARDDAKRRIVALLERIEQIGV